MALKIIFVHRVFLIVLLALLDKLHSGAIQITDCIVVHESLHFLGKCAAKASVHGVAYTL